MLHGQVLKQALIMIVVGVRRINIKDNQLEGNDNFISFYFMVYY